VQVATRDGTSAALFYLLAYTFLVVGTFAVVTLVAAAGLAFALYLAHVERDDGQPERVAARRAHWLVGVDERRSAHEGWIFCHGPTPDLTAN